MSIKPGNIWHYDAASPEQYDLEYDEGTEMFALTASPSRPLGEPALHRVVLFVHRSVLVELATAWAAGTGAAQKPGPEPEVGPGPPVSKAFT